uniref:RING-type E3 ubiquitin transferase n=1 Tax=Chrysemys picta bellii TaxID=8478 RepID=A0A8C3IXF0_CHRPI
MGPGDRVQCFCCGGILRSWEAEDQPMREHQKFFPTCKFICGEDVGNQQMLPFLEILDYVDGQILSLLQRMDVEEAALPSQPEYPEMETEAMRLATFQSWPPYTELYPEQLARAGFFYTGRHGDTVRCFYCDGSLRNWELGDDPWREHAKWFPRCEFLLQSRGRDFVSSVQDSDFNAPVSLKWVFCAVEGGKPPLSTEEQLRRLQEERMCKVCMDKDVSIVFVPCGHLVVCAECAPSLRRCPICRAVIRGSVRTFMS